MTHETTKVSARESSVVVIICQYVYDVRCGLIEFSRFDRCMPFQVAKRLLKKTCKNRKLINTESWTHHSSLSRIFPGREARDPVIVKDLVRIKQGTVSVL